MKRPLPNLLVQGFQLGLRNWPCVVWAYAVNLFFSLLAAVPFATGLSSYLDHSLAAQKIAGTLDLAYSWGAVHPPPRHRLFSHGHAHCRLAESASAAGALYFFRRQRLCLRLRRAAAAFGTAARRRRLFLAICARRNPGRVRGRDCPGDSAWCTGRVCWLGSAQSTSSGRCFSYAAISGAVVLLVALLLRLWWDLVEVYIVRNAMDGERRVRQALLPALRLLLPIFLPHLWQLPSDWYGRRDRSCLVPLSLESAARAPGMDGCSAGTAWALSSARQPVLATRGSRLRWSCPPIRPASRGKRWPRKKWTADCSRMRMLAPPAYRDILAGLSEPTLRDLVQKLRTEPWANPDVLSGPLHAPDAWPEAAPAARQTGGGQRAFYLAARPARNKIPAGRREPRQRSCSGGPRREAESRRYPRKTAHSEKKPLP